MPTTKIFSHRLRELCSSAPSISHVARDLQINRQQFARYLNGTTMPRGNVVQQIADYFSVDPSALYRNVPTDQAEETPLTVLNQVMDSVLMEPILPHELPPGFYMQYKQSFSMAGKILVNLVQISERGGVYRYKRRSSVRLRNALPGLNVRHTYQGVFFKQGGMLVMVDVGARMGEMTYHAFRISSIFDLNVKPGLHMTPGRHGSVGPRAARIVLHRLPEGVSVLQHAREQRLMTLEEVPEVIRIHLQAPAGETGGIFSIS